MNQNILRFCCQIFRVVESGAGVLIIVGVGFWVG